VGLSQSPRSASLNAHTRLTFSFFSIRRFRRGRVSISRKRALRASQPRQSRRVFWGSAGDGRTGNEKGSFGALCVMRGPYESTIRETEERKRYEHERRLTRDNRIIIISVCTVEDRRLPSVFRIIITSFLSTPQLSKNTSTYSSRKHLPHLVRHAPRVVAVVPRQDVVRFVHLFRVVPHLREPLAPRTRGEPDVRVPIGVQNLRHVPVLHGDLEHVPVSRRKQSGKSGVRGG